MLDFIGQAHRNVRFDLRYLALLGGTRDQLEQQIKDGSPFLPAGCSLQLDRVSSERVLANLRESLPTRRPELLKEARSLGRCSLAGLLEGLGMELGEFYKVAGSWALLQRDLGWLASGAALGEPSDDEKRLGRRVGRLLHLDDTDRLSFLLQGLASRQPPHELSNSSPGNGRRLGRQLLGRLRAQGFCLSKSGDPLAAAAGDSGGVAARLLCRTPAVVSRTSCCVAHQLLLGIAAGLAV